MQSQVAGLAELAEWQKTEALADLRQQMARFGEVTLAQRRDLVINCESLTSTEEKYIP